MIKKSERGGLSAQKALARVVNDMVHGKLPDVGSLESSGQALAGAAVRDHGGKVSAAERRQKNAKSQVGISAAADELAALHRELCACKFGATIPQDSAAESVPVRSSNVLADEVLNLRRINQEQQDELIQWRQQPDVAKRERERADRADVRAADAREKARDALQELKVALVAVAAAAEQVADELAQEHMERAERKAAAAVERLELAIAAKREATQQAAAVEVARKATEAKAAGQIVGALKEAERSAEARIALEADFEAAVERRVLQQTDHVRSELEKEYAEQIAAAEETCTARKKREKAEQRRATESAKRLERVKKAEGRVKELEADIEQLHERLQGLAAQGEQSDAESDEEATQGEAGRVRGRFSKFDWRTRNGFTDAVQMTQPPKPPQLTAALAGTQLEICWGNYISTEDNKTRVKMWCPAKVLRVADGNNDKGRDGKPLSERATKLAPRGMVLLEWEPDPERGERQSTTMWLLLAPGKWNGDGHRAWRYHPSELAAQAARDAAARASGKRPCANDRQPQRECE